MFYKPNHKKIPSSRSYLQDIVVVFGLARQLDGRSLDGVQVVRLEQEPRRTDVIYHGHLDRPGGGRSQLVLRPALVRSWKVREEKER